MNATPEVPASLAQRVHLLAYDPEKQRVRSVSHLAMIVRAAALTDLHLAGAVRDRDGKVEAVAGTVLHDPVLAELHQQILDSARVRRWKAWVTRRPRPALAAVRQQLADAGLARVTSSKALGLFPRTVVEVRATRTVTALRTTVDRALGDGPVTQLDPRDAATAALAATGRMRWVVSARKARERKQRLTQLAVVAGPAVPALRKAISDQDSTSAA